MNDRAKAGGEIGVNGSYYKGGQFLPYLQDGNTWTKKQKARLSKKQNIAPYTWECPPSPFHSPIFKSIVVLKWDHDNALFVIPTEDEIEGMVNGYFTLETVMESIERAQAYNNGERWYVNPYLKQ